MNPFYCPVPWNEVHINADGTYHTCGAQANNVSNTEFGKTHNVFCMTIDEWQLSQHQRRARQEKLVGIEAPECVMCYTEDRLQKSSKRARELQKFVSLPKEYQQNDFVRKPISYHVSIGNECNFACKMCQPIASSKVAVEWKQQARYTGETYVNWTKDPAAWNRVTNHMLTNPYFKFLHILGGEPFIVPKFEELIDLLLKNGLQDLKYLGLTTNGSVVNTRILDKLKQFRYVDIGISIETADILNNHIRKGSKIDHLLSNIEQFLSYREQGKFVITIRTVPSALSVHTIDKLFAWCIDHQVDIMSNTLVMPEHLQIRQLPSEVKLRLREKFAYWQYSDKSLVGIKDRDELFYREHIDAELRAIVRQLELPNDAAKTEQLYDQLGRWGWLDDAEIRQHFVLE